MFIVRIFFALCAMSGFWLMIFGAAIAEMPGTVELLIGFSMMLMGVISAITFTVLLVRGFD
jgi:hypothetical protein